MVVARFFGENPKKPTKKDHWPFLSSVVTHTFICPRLFVVGFLSGDKEKERKIFIEETAILKRDLANVWSFEDLVKIDQLKKKGQGQQYTLKAYGFSFPSSKDNQPTKVAVVFSCHISRAVMILYQHLSKNGEKPSSDTIFCLEALWSSQDYLNGKIDREKVVRVIPLPRPK